MAKPQRFKGIIGKEKSLRHPNLERQRDECGIVPNNAVVSEDEYREYMKARMREKVNRARIPVTKI